MMHVQGYGYGPPPAMREEVVFLSEQGVQITSARFTVHQQMYPVAAITSVSPFTVPAKRGGPIALIVLLSLFAFPNVVRFLHEGSSDAFGGALFMMALVGAAVWWMRSRKPTHGVMITTSGMQARALATPDAAFVQRVVHALNHAVIAR